MISIPIAIDADHPAFAGHFPSHPVVPGVVLLDESLRAIGRTRSMPASIRIGAAKFLSMVVPGDPVRLECETTNDTTNDTTNATTLTLRVFAGSPGAERLAMTGSLVLAGRSDGR